MYQTEPVQDGRTVSVEHLAGIIVIGSLAFLILVKRGFRGVGVPGVGNVSLS